MMNFLYRILLIYIGISKKFFGDIFCMGEYILVYWFKCILEYGE